MDDGVKGDLNLAEIIKNCALWAHAMIRAMVAHASPHSQLDRIPLVQWPLPVAISEFFATSVRFRSAVPLS